MNLTASLRARTRLLCADDAGHGLILVQCKQIETIDSLLDLAVEHGEAEASGAPSEEPSVFEKLAALMGTLSNSEKNLFHQQFQPQPSASVSATHSSGPQQAMQLGGYSASLPPHRAVGKYECTMYKGTKSWNTWHTVEIREGGVKGVLKWSNVANAIWTLYDSGWPGELEVGNDCPYFKSGHTRCKLVQDPAGNVIAVMGPWNERYDRVG